VIDGRGGKPIDDGVIVIQRDRIVTVGGPETPVPPAAQRLPMAGKYVIPGLLDANVHLVLDYFPATLVRFWDRYDELAIEAAAIALRNGVTTVFDTWGPRTHLIRARTAIREGRSVGSRIFLAGNIVGLDGPLSEDFFPAARESLFEEFTDRTNALWQEGVGRELMWTPLPQLRQAVRRHAENEIDFLRFAVSGHGAKVARYLQFSPRVQKAIIEEAHGAGLTAQAHTTSVEAVELSLDAGVDLLQQASTTGVETLPEETIARLVSVGIPCGIVPNTAKALNLTVS
jgi:imidazolonepropionase-like amidohydrolase